MSTEQSVNGYASGTAKGSSVPIAHLDYAYIDKCNDQKQLEDIILVLRSGSEGFYPDLVDYTEKKLMEINPKSSVLRKENPVESFSNLDKMSQKEVSDDLENWVSEMNGTDSKLKVSGSDKVNSDSIPPIRTAKKMQLHQENNDKPNNSGTNKAAKPRDYTEWDKLDINKELADVDKQEKVQVKNVNEKAKLEPKPTVTTGLNGEERMLRSVKEKEKGNEAFRAHDYEEAVVYYSDSLSYEPTAASYNNRAAAEIKLKKYAEAIEDCNMVLEMEPSNIKAFLRRGIAYKEQKQYELAVKDFTSVLTFDVDNKRAKELLSEIEELEKNERDATPDELNCVKDVKNHIPQDAKSRKTGQRLKIVDVTDTEEEMNAHSELHADKGSGDEGNKTGNTGKSTSKGRRVKIEEIDGSVCEDGTSVYENETTVYEEQKTNVCSKSKNKQTETNALGLGEKETPTLVEADVQHQRLSNDGTGNENTETKIFDRENVSSENDFRNTDTNSMVDAEIRIKSTDESPTSETETSSTVDEVGPSPTDDGEGETGITGVAKVAPQLPVEVRSIIIEGQEAYKAGQYSDAFDKFSKSVDLLWKDQELYSSDMSKLLSNKAACCLKMGDCKECIKLCSLSLQLVSDNTRVLMRRGQAYETLEKYAEAFHDFNRVRLLDSSNKFAQDHCSRVIRHLEILHGKSWRKKIFELNKNDESKDQTFPITDKCKQTTTATSPPTFTSPTTTLNQHPIRTPPITSTSTSTMFPPQSTACDPKNSQQQGKTSKGNLKPNAESAAPECRIEKEFGDDKQAKFLKLKDSGNLLVKQGKHSEAIHCYTDCIKICPEQVASYTNRALCYLETNKYEKAEEDCSTALTIQDNNIKALFRRAKARKEMGKYRDSSEDLVALLKIDSKNLSAKKELPEVLRLLKKEKKNIEKRLPKRKRILIKDIESDVSNAGEKERSGSTERTKNEEDKPKRNNNTKNTTTKVKSNKTQQTGKNITTSENSESKAGGKPTVYSATTNSREKQQTTTTKPIVKTAFQFLQAWESVKKGNNEGYLNILKQINLADVSKVISNRLDSDMLHSMFAALHLELKMKGDLKFIFNFLQKLQYADRFEMVLMFLSPTEKQAVSRLFDEMIKESKTQAVLNGEDVIKLRRRYCS